MCCVLPRVTKTLGQFISPIATSFSRAKPATREQGAALPGFTRQDRSNLPQDKPKEQKKEPQQSLEPEAEPEKKPAPPELKLVANPEPKPEPGASLTDAFVQMCNRFQNQRAAAMKWLGVRSYKRVAKDQRRTSRFRKGAVVDDKAS